MTLGDGSYDGDNDNVVVLVVVFLCFVWSCCALLPFFSLIEYFVVI